jgi:integrase
VTSGPVRRACGRCDRHGFPAAHFPDGYLCGPCLRAALDIRGTCPGCGTSRALPGRRPADHAPLCRDCAGISRHFTCLDCDYEGNMPLGRLCAPCALTRAAARILADSTGSIAPALRPLAAALAARPNPAATLAWLSTPHIGVLLAGLADGAIPLTHQALAARPDWRSSIYLRDLLVDCGLLPATDRQLADYEGWLHRRLDHLTAHPHQRLLRQYGLWHQLPKMRARAAAAPLRPSARIYAEGRFNQAENFLTWAAAAGRQPARLTQADIDTWHATQPIGARQGARSFLTWAMTSHHIPASQLPPIRFPQGEAITQHRRLTLLRRYISDDQPPARIRAAACLMLLYAQPLTRVLRLTTSDITRDDNGQTLIHLGHPPAPVPEPFASLLLQLTTHRPPSTGTWLFPGRNPGQPADYRTISTQLRACGFPLRTARISALRQLVLQAPAPVIATALGFHHTTTQRQHATAGATWNRYPAGDHAK